jgi:arylsulfatase A-like enzyme
VTDAEFLFAALVGLSVAMLRARIEIVYCVWRTDLWLFFPLLLYQDVIAVTFLGWLSYGVFALVRNPVRHKIIRRTGYCLVFALVLFTSVDTVVFSYIRAMASYKLLVISDNLHMIKGSITDILDGGAPYLWVALGILILWTVTEFLSRMAPQFLRQLRNKFCSVVTLLLTVVYVVVAHWWTAHYLSYPAAGLNAEWAFVLPLFQHQPKLPASIPSNYLEDFMPAGGRPATVAAAAALSHNGHPLNVVMIVMESVGANDLSVYGAPYPDTPQIERLAAHAAVFKNIYAAQANTSAAMAAIFCSLYPRLGWFPIPRWRPSLAARGLPAILAQRGYATALIDSGSLSEDRRSEFLLDHGFATVIGAHRDPRLPQDPPLLSDAVDWISAHRSKPFFLTLWTMDTHHPYIVDGQQNYGLRDPLFDRYLNGVHSIDALIGKLADRLQEMGLADNTLLVITGDHGEAFGEHGQKIHGFTVYNEEVHVPLLIVNGSLFQKPQVIKSIGRQIDIAPTLLGLLGVHEPARWQGLSLFSGPDHRRAYLFSGDGNFIMGLIDADMKYVYDFNLDRAELYNLAADPHERDNLESEQSYKPLTDRYKLHLQAWTSFQDAYLRRIADPPPDFANPRQILAVR